MRKLLLTTAFVLPLGAMPILAQDAATTEAPADTTAPMDNAAGTEAPADGTMAADPAEADAAAKEAEMAASGKVVQDQAANELRVDWITNASVTSPDGATIGDINDLILDGESGQMIAAVIGVGGFLGIGEKQIAVPWDQLTVNYDAQEITSELTEEEADAAPEYVFRERESAPAVGGDTMATDPAAVPADTTGGTDAMAPAPADGAATDMTAPADGTAAPADGTAPADGAMDMEAEPAEGGDATATEAGNMAAEPADSGDSAEMPAEGGEATDMPAEGAETTEEAPANN